jgi:hypothetical protein
VHFVLEDNLKGTSGNLKAKGMGDAISRPVIIITSIRVGSAHGQIKSSSGYPTKNSRWFSEGFDSSQGRIMTETEHWLFLWFPMWAGRLFTTLLYQDTQPSGAFGQARRLSA